jgi:hypothetical protein
VKIANAMGYGSPKQVAGRRAFNMYQDLCVRRADEESAFWTTGKFGSQSYFACFGWVPFHFTVMSSWGMCTRLQMAKPFVLVLRNEFTDSFHAMSLSPQMMCSILLRRRTVPMVYIDGFKRQGLYSQSR